MTRQQRLADLVAIFSHCSVHLGGPARDGFPLLPTEMIEMESLMERGLSLVQTL